MKKKPAKRGASSGSVAGIFAEFLARLSLAIFPEDSDREPADIPAGRKFLFAFLGSATTILFLASAFTPQGLLEILGADRLGFPWSPAAAAISIVYALCVFFALLFAYMIAEGKISGILRAYLRGVLVPLFVFSVLRFAVN